MAYLLFHYFPTQTVIYKFLKLLHVIKTLFLSSITDPSSSDTPKEGSEKEGSKQSSNSSSTSSRDGKEKKGGHSSRERKRERRRRKHSSPVPKLRRKTSKIGNAAEHYVQSILLSYFQAFDQNNTGLITPDDFWNVSIIMD